jgi:hypothetical protein
MILWLQEKVVPAAAAKLKRNEAERVGVVRKILSTKLRRRWLL